MTKFNLLSAATKSTNGTMQIALLVLYAIGALFGIGEELIDGAWMAIIPIVAAIREITKGERKATFGQNVLVYLFDIILIFAPWLADALASLSEIIGFLLDGDTNRALQALFYFANILWALIRTKPWENRG